MAFWLNASLTSQPEGAKPLRHGSSSKTSDPDALVIFALSSSCPACHSWLTFQNAATPDRLSIGIGIVDWVEDDSRLKVPHSIYFTGDKPNWRNAEEQPLNNFDAAYEGRSSSYSTFVCNVLTEARWKPTHPLVTKPTKLCEKRLLPHSPWQLRLLRLAILISWTLLRKAPQLDVLAIKILIIP